MRAESLQPLILWACPIRSLAVTNHTVSIGNLDTIRYKESNLTDSFIPILKGFLKTWGSLLIIPFIAQRILIWQKSILAAVPPNGGSGGHVLYAEMEYALSQQISFRQNRKNYSEFRALLEGGRRCDAPAVQFRDLFGKSQSQAISGCVPGLFA